MTVELWQLFGVAVSYLALLFLIAWLAERGFLPEWIARHPLTCALSLGVYATSWSFYGSVGFAHDSGFNFLTIYLGVTIAFLLAPVLLDPILRLVREYQLTSVADLFAFRYPGRLTGFVVTTFMLLGILPYLSLQIHALIQSVEVLTREPAHDFLALVFCAMLIVFSILFGARHISPREKHSGLVVAIAFESAVKMVALLAVGIFAVFGVFGGFGEMEQWAGRNPEALASLYEPITTGPWLALTVLAFAAAFLLPRQFHMAFTENLDPQGLRTAGWLFPAFLLVLNLPIIPILWAGMALDTSGSPDFYVLGITLDHAPAWLPILAFVGGISAASAMMIVSTIALAAMCLNHLILPARFLTPRPQPQLYNWILWGKRGLIALIILAGYGFYRVMVHHEGLVQLGLVSFVAVAQLLPGVAGVLFWSRATRTGFVTGLFAGTLVWFVMLVLPLLGEPAVLTGETPLEQLIRPAGGDIWTIATFWTLAINTLFFVLGSLLTAPSEGEQRAAAACTEQRLTPLAGRVEAGSPRLFEHNLARLIGEDAAENEVAKALDELNMSPDELRPAELRMLRERIERNLSGLVGPVLAQLIVDDRLRLEHRSHVALADGIRFMEERLATSRDRLRGAVAQLQSLQRYHRDVLQELPIGVCSVAPDGEIVIWNRSMEELSGIERREATGKPLASLPSPWADVLQQFSRSGERRQTKASITGNDGSERWVNLHQAWIENPHLRDTPGGGSLVLLVEDRTDVETLEAELRHSERLASIGRLAAGLAHEVGNPLTGIDSLSQNLPYDATDASRQATSQAIREQTARISAIVESLLAFARSGQQHRGSHEAIALRELIHQVIRLVALGQKDKVIEFHNETRAATLLHGDAQQLRQVFVNLLSNAADASTTGQSVVVRERREDSEIVISIIDNGSGIEPDHVERAFDPFFTTKPVGRGTGLGLSLSHAIISEHGGTITLAQNHPQGTIATVRLPADTQGVTTA